MFSCICSYRVLILVVDYSKRIVVRKNCNCIRHMTILLQLTTEHQTPSVIYSLVPRPCPDPALSRGKRSGDYWAISWLCWVNSLDFGQDNEIVPCHPSMLISQWNSLTSCKHVIDVRSKIDTAESAQPRNRSSHQTLFLTRGWGLGTRLLMWGSPCTCSCCHCWESMKVPSHLVTVPHELNFEMVLQ